MLEGPALILATCFAATAVLAQSIHVSPTLQTVPGAGGPFSFQVTTNPAGLHYTVTNSADWIFGFSTAGIGSSTFSYAVLRNTTGAPRVANFHVGDATLVVTQASFERAFVTPVNLELPAPGGNAVIQVTTTSPAYSWRAVSSEPWLTITSGQSGTGVGEVRVSAGANQGITRTAVISVGDPEVYTGTLVKQAGQGALRFLPVAPCRVLDTRNPAGPLGGPSLNAGETRSFQVLSSNCGIPSDAAAYSLNVTVVPQSTVLGYLVVYPGGRDRPLASTLNSTDGRIKAVGTIVNAGSNGSLDVFTTDATDIVLDVNGVFVPAATHLEASVYYPLATTCRAVDTRIGLGSAGPLPAGGTRVFSLPTVAMSTACGWQANSDVTAWAFNVTAVPAGNLGFLTMWPTDSRQPYVSTLNSPPGEVVANFAIVPTDRGDVSVFATDRTDLVIDVMGFFSTPDGAPSLGTGLQYYAAPPCRAVDTRNAAGPFGGPALAAGQIRTFFVSDMHSPCPVPMGSYPFLNATAVPQGPLGFLTLWPYRLICGDGPICQPQMLPPTSTLNAPPGGIMSNGAIVGSSLNAYATSAADLILDVNGFFAP